MAGTLALVGSGEFLEVMRPIDAGLLRGLALRGLPAALTVIGVDEETALVQDGDRWQVRGRSGVEIRRAGGRARYRSGDTLTL